MNATMAASGTKAVTPVASSIQEVALAKIRESKTNPRRFFDEAKLAELADNIRQHGVLQPILLRPLPEGEAGTYELVAGARRFRASKLAKRESIPATVRELTDAQALELQVILQSGTESRRTAEPDVKTNALGRVRPINVQEMMDYVRAYLRITQARPTVVKNYFCERHVRYAAS